MMNTVNHVLLLVADKSLEKLKSMSDEELLSTLENCEDSSISHAIDYGNFDFFKHEKPNRNSIENEACKVKCNDYINQINTRGKEGDE